LELLSRFDKNTDKFEIFLLKNIFPIPEFIDIEKPKQSVPKKRSKKDIEDNPEQLANKIAKVDQEIQDLQQKVAEVKKIFDV
jgi:hypothetical protein